MELGCSLERSDPFAPLYKISSQARGPTAVPVFLDIELTNHCTLRCTMCPQSGLMTRKRGNMSTIQLSRIVNEAREIGVKGIRFVRWGEPTLWAGGDLIENLPRSLLVHFHTNGQCSYDILTQLNMADSVKFSLQGSTPEEYEQIRGVPIDNVLWACHTLHHLRGKSKTPYITVGTTVSDPLHPIGTLYDLFSPFCDSFAEGNTKDLTQEKTHGVIRGCNETNAKLSINWDGTVSACCADYNNKMLVGDLTQETLMDIWRGPRLADIRAQVANSELTKLPVCRKCQYVVAD